MIASFKNIEACNDFQRKKKKIFNLGISALRMIACFLVVTSHFPIATKSKILINLLKYRPYHVPIFFTVSFYLSYNTFKSNNICKIIKRFERLLIPYICWPIIILCVNSVIYHKFSINLPHSLISLTKQLLFGVSYLDVFWFQWDLIFISLVFIIIICLCKKNYYFFLILLMFISIYFSYSGTNLKIFSKYPYHKKYTLGRISESIPFCVIGFLLGGTELTKFCEKYRFKVLFFTFLFQYFFIKFNIFTDFNGFMYQGLDKVVVSSLIFLLFELFPSNIISNKIIITGIKQITNYTMGIYVLHVPIAKYMNVKIINYKSVNIVHSGNFTASLIIYLICYLCSFLCIKIVKITKMSNLFS